VEKLLYALRCPEARAVELVSRLHERLQALSRSVAHLRVIECRSSHAPRAFVSGFLPCHDRRAGLEEVLSTLGARVDGYLVTEGCHGELTTGAVTMAHRRSGSAPSASSSRGTCAAVAKPIPTYRSYATRWRVRWVMARRPCVPW
jgi:hypothetical protein